MTEEKKHVSKGNDEADIDKDPAPDEIEIDQANDVMGGPTTESLNSGLSSILQSGGTIPGAGQGSIGTGGGQADRNSGDVDG